MKIFLRTIGALVLSLVVLIAVFAWSQNYTIRKEEAVDFGDSVQEVESKKGLLRSRSISLEEVNPAYHSEEWVSIVRNEGRAIRSYYLFGPNAPLRSGFVVVFNGEGKVFVVIPTDT
jgi:hypothetical protein